jgi:hypothetical protein
VSLQSVEGSCGTLVEQNIICRKYREFAHMTCVTNADSQPSVEISPLWISFVQREQCYQMFHLSWTWISLDVLHRGCLHDLYYRNILLTSFIEPGDIDGNFFFGSVCENLPPDILVFLNYLITAWGFGHWIFNCISCWFMDQFELSVVILCPCITFFNVMQISWLPLMLFWFLGME